MGTPVFAVPCFERLIAEGHRVAAAVCQPDKPKGRGLQMLAPPVKQAALAHGVEVLQPPTLRDGEALEQLRALAPELMVVVAYGKILPPEFLALPRCGCINVHASLLPKYRGAAPMQWAILNGETETGVTAMQMDAGLDTGDMLLQRKIVIPPDMDAAQLHDELSALGADTLAETLRLLETGRLQPQKQPDAAVSYAPMLSRALSWLDWNASARKLHDTVRGLYPWPGAEGMLDGKRIKIRKTRHAPEVLAGAPGMLEQRDGHVFVSCGDSVLELLEIQPEGKRAMPPQAYLRGLRTNGSLRFQVK
jgi:methionyl-tRNA formyltransferase